MSLNLKGVIAAVPTPFGYDGEVAYEKLTSNLHYWNQTDLHGILILGSTGEFPHLSADEKLKVMEAVKEAMPPEKVLLVGTGELSTRQTIEMTKHAAECGADAALVVTPFYYKKILTEEHLALHYQRIADASPIPILVYLIPQFAGVYLMPETVAHLAQHPNIIGLKESSGDLQSLNDLLREVGGMDFSVMVGSPVIMKQALAAGATGAILAVAAMAPHACTALEKACRWNDEARSDKLQERLAALSRTATSPGIGHLKAAMDLVGLYGFLPRSPLPAPTDQEREQISRAIEDSEFFSPVEGGKVWIEKTEIE